MVGAANIVFTAILVLMAILIVLTLISEAYKRSAQKSHRAASEQNQRR